MGFKRIKNIFVHKTISNGIWMYLLQIFNTIIPLVTLPYVTRILGTTEYGVFSIALNIVGYLQVVIEYGFGMSATRKVAMSDKKQEQLDKEFTVVLLSRIFLLSICGIFSVIYIMVNWTSIKESICFMMLTLSLVGYCVQQNWLFQGLQEMKYISIINIFARLVSVILTFVFVRAPNDIILYCFLYAASPCISGFLSLWLAKKKYYVKVIKIDMGEILKGLNNGWYVFTTQLSSKVFGAIGITFLGLFEADSVVGIYSAIQKIPNIMLLAWLPISQVMYPISSKRLGESFTLGKKSIYKVRRVILTIFTILAIVVALMSKFVVNIAFGVEYVAYYYWIIPLLLWMCCSINNNFLGVQILLGSGHDKEYSKCFQLGVVSTIILNLFLIYLWGGMGAACAPLLSECILYIALKNEVRKLERI